MQIQRSVQSLAELALSVQEKGLALNWSDYIKDQRERSGISREQLVQEMKRIREST